MIDQVSPDDLRDDELLDYLETSEFAEKARVMRKRVEDGEPMTMEQISNGLGIPFAFFAGCLAFQVMKTSPGTTVLISDEREALH